MTANSQEQDQTIGNHLDQPNSQQSVQRRIKFYGDVPSTDVWYREYVDEWIAAEGNDLAVKTALETEFGTIDSGIEQVREETRNR